MRRETERDGGRECGWDRIDAFNYFFSTFLFLFLINNKTLKINYLKQN